MYTKENLKYNKDMFDLSDTQYDYFCDLVIKENIPVYESLGIVRGNKPKPVKKDSNLVSFGQKKVNKDKITDHQRIWEWFIRPENNARSFCCEEVAGHINVPKDIVFKRFSEFKKAFLLIPESEGTYKGRDGSPVTVTMYKADSNKPYEDIAPQLDAVKKSSNSIPKVLTEASKALLLRISDRYLTEEERHQLIVDHATSLLDYVTLNPQVKYLKNRYSVEKESLSKMEETLEILRKLDKNVK